MTPEGERRPGDIILDHYVPNLGPEEREEARAQLYGLVAWQMRIVARLLRENGPDSSSRECRDTLDSAFQDP